MIGPSFVWDWTKTMIRQGCFPPWNVALFGWRNSKQELNMRSLGFTEMILDQAAEAVKAKQAKKDYAAG